MLSIGKLSAASVDYYTEQLSHSVGEDVPVLREGPADQRVDYYAGYEAPARWMGSSLEAVGVDPASPVTKEAFARLMSHETLSSESMTRARAAHGSVAAFDHTLSAPKSVSLVYAFGDGQVRAQAREAHLEAVSQAVEFMETRCAQARVVKRWRDEAGRWHRSTRNVDSEGWVASAFDHYTSRANDPQLHTHVVVINRVRTEDGWRALDARRNYMHAKAGGTVYESVLRDELTRRLGVSWGPVVNGIADIEGFSPELLRYFSTRRAEILEAAEAYAARNGGQIHARMLQKFTLETRQPKAHPRGEPPVAQEMRDYGVGSDVVAHWRQRADQAPQDPAEVVRAVVRIGREGLRPDPTMLEESAPKLVVEASDRHAVFTERDLIAQVSESFPDGATPSELIDATSEILEAAVASGEAIPMPSHRSDERWTLPDDTRYTTRTQVERERAVLRAVHHPSPVRVDLETIDQKAELRDLTAEQTSAIHRLADLDGRIVALAGPGGSGKTYAIGAYVDAARVAGHHVIGAAPTATASQRLAQDLGGHWTGSIAMLTHHLERRDEALPFGTVVVCDEASMVSTKDLAHLTRLVEASDGKLVLLGDPHQLPSIDSGALFHRIVADGHGVVTVEVNQRQQHELDRRTLHQFRTGHVDRAVFDYIEAGRVHIGHDRLDTMTGLVDAWWADARAHGIEAVRILAGRRSDVDMLNHLARTRMQVAGFLTGPAMETRSGITLQVGDRVTVRANWYVHYDVRNGQTGTVTAIDHENGRVTFRRDYDRIEVALPRRYVDQSVDHGYAQTIHTAQGHTYDQVHVYIDETMTAEHGYTGFSRARGETHVWTADLPGPLGDCSHIHYGSVFEDRIDRLSRQLSRTGVRPPATEPKAAVQKMSDCELINRRDELARSVGDGLLEQPAPDIEALDQAITGAHAAVKEVGTTGARAQLDMLSRQRNDAFEAINTREAWVNQHTDRINEYAEIKRGIDLRVAARTVLYRTNPPQELLDALGMRGDDPNPKAWDAAVAVYAKTRFEVGPNVDINDPAIFGAGPWHDALRQVQQVELQGPVLRPM